MAKEKRPEKDKDQKEKKAQGAATELGDDDLSKVSGGTGCPGGPGPQHHDDT